MMSHEAEEQTGLAFSSFVVVLFASWERCCILGWAVTLESVLRVWSLGRGTAYMT